MKTPLAPLLIFLPVIAAAKAAPSAPSSLYEMKATSIDGDEIALARYKGKVALVVNTASKCGFTPQYKGLQSLYDKYSKDGLVVLGFPSNDFFHQDPGTNAEIHSFCQKNYGVTFPLFEKDHVKGRETQPVFKFLKASEIGSKDGEIGWNFTKFLIDKDGKVAARFSTRVDPQSKEVTSKIEELLKAAR